MSLFSKEKNHLKLPDAELIYLPNFLDESQSNFYFDYFLNHLEWQQDDITVFGKTYQQPRLTALYGENEKPYRYSNITMHPKPMPAKLQKLKNKVEMASNHEYSSVLLNLYRTGMDSNGWHADNEKELGINPIIASLSLGAERIFHIKHKVIKEEIHKFLLHNGSLLIMKGSMQHHWLHQIPKTKREIGKRINLTFRKIQNV